jgi:hypothetical protein
MSAANITEAKIEAEIRIIVEVSLVRSAGSRPGLMPVIPEWLEGSQWRKSGAYIKIG